MVNFLAELDAELDYYIFSPWIWLKNTNPFNKTNQK